MNFLVTFIQESRTFREELLSDKAHVCAKNILKPLHPAVAVDVFQNITLHFYEVGRSVIALTILSYFFHSCFLSFYSSSFHLPASFFPSFNFFHIFFLSIFFLSDFRPYLLFSHALFPFSFSSGLLFIFCLSLYIPVSFWLCLNLFFFVILSFISFAPIPILLHYPRLSAFLPVSSSGFPSSSNEADRVATRLSI